MSSTNAKGTLNSLPIYLANTVEAGERYQRRLVPVELVEGGTSEDRLIFSAQGERVWEIRDWSGGEGDQHWRRGPNRYRVSEGCRPARFDAGVELSAHWAPTYLSDESVFAPLLVWLGTLASGQEVIWGINGNNDCRYLLPASTADAEWQSDLETGITTGDTPVSAVGLGNLNYVSFGDESIWRFSESASLEVIASGAASWTVGPSLTAYQGVLYALGTDDLYTVTVGSTTKVVDNLGTDADYATDTRPEWMSRRLTVSDVGPLWVTRERNGGVFVWEYNVAADTPSLVAQVAYGAGWWPMGIAWVNGAIYVPLYSEGDPFSGYGGADPGRAYLWARAGGQTSLIGPLQTDLSTRTNEESDTAPRLVGASASDLYLFSRQRLWAYHFSTGGLHRVTSEIVNSTATEVSGGCIHGDTILLAEAYFDGTGTRPVTVSVNRYREPTTYSTLHSGHFDFDQPGIPKRMIEVAVLTDDLPADCTVDVAVIPDRGTLVASPGVSSTTGQNLHTFDFTTTAVIGREFELELRLDYNGSAVFANTPTVRSVYARTRPGASRREWVLYLDVSRSNEEGAGDLLAALDALVDGHSVVNLVDPWLVDEGASASTYEVTVEEVRLMHDDSGQVRHVTVRLLGNDWI